MIIGLALAMAAENREAPAESDYSSAAFGRGGGWNVILCRAKNLALCLMLRSQGIPARIIVGYRPDEYNSLGNYYQVRQGDPLVVE